MRKNRGDPASWGGRPFLIIKFPQVSRLLDASGFEQAGHAKGVEGFSIVEHAVSSEEG